jgi:hypothetical protein
MTMPSLWGQAWARMLRHRPSGGKEAASQASTGCERGVPVIPLPGGPQMEWWYAWAAVTPDHRISATEIPWRRKRFDITNSGRPLSFAGFSAR